MDNSDKQNARFLGEIDDIRGISAFAELLHWPEKWKEAISHIKNMRAPKKARKKQFEHNPINGVKPAIVIVDEIAGIEDIETRPAVVLGYRPA